VSVVSAHAPSSQSGVVLLEALIGIMIFSIGILALVALGTTAITVQADAQYRTEAMNLAERMSSAIWTGVARTPEGEVDPVALAAYRQQDGGDDCTFSGSEATRQEVIDWLAAVRSSLPGSVEEMQQVAVNPARHNQVSITICWQAPADQRVRHYTLVTYVN
jgi:type IV pilus assembly protein PilV